VTGLGHLRYRFTFVFVSSVSPSGDGEEMRERVTFEYGSVAQRYTQAGTVFAAGWNQVANMACNYGSCNASPTVP
jgi:type VI protein secretion system component Hcp